MREFVPVRPRQPGPGGIEALYEQALDLAVRGCWPELLAVVEATDPQAMFFKTLCLRLRVKGAFEVLKEMREGLPETHIVAPIADYYAGVALIAEKRYVESLAYFHRFKQLMLHNLQLYRPLLADHGFRLIFRQGTLVEPLSFVKSLDDGSYGITERDPDLEVHAPAECGTSPVIFACCLNDLYFLRFAESLVATMESACGAVPLHFNVMGTQQDCLPLFEDLRQRYPKISLGLSLEAEPVAPSPVYYACDRFDVTPQLWRLYDRDVMMLDADGLVRRDLTAFYRRIVAQEHKPDFACFDTGRVEPASVYQATLMHFANSPGCAEFLRLVRRFVLSKVNQPVEISWLLDQSAMFSVSLYLEHAEGKDFTFCRLDEFDGDDLDIYVDSTGTEDEKEVLMKAGHLKAA